MAGNWNCLLSKSFQTNAIKQSYRCLSSGTPRMAVMATYKVPKVENENNVSNDYPDQ